MRAKKRKEKADGKGKAQKKKKKVVPGDAKGVKLVCCTDGSKKSWDAFQVIFELKF